MLIFWGKPCKYSFAFIFKSLTIVCISSLLALACSTQPEKTKLEKKIHTLLSRMQSSAIGLDHALDKLSKTKRVNSLERFRETVKIVNETEKKLEKANQDVEKYILFVKENACFLEREKLAHYINVKKILNNTFSKKRSSIAAFLVKMRKWLEYSANNFERLKTGENGFRMNYDRLLMDVNRGLKTYNNANARYHQFLLKFLKNNPKLIQHFRPEYKKMKKELGWL